MRPRRVLGILLICALLLTMLSVSILSADAVVEYELLIDGVAVTSDNAADILGNGVFAYSLAENTLFISGDYTTDSDNFIIESGIMDLTIRVDGEVSLSGNNYALRTIADTTMTGGTLALNRGISVRNGATLSIVDMDLMIDTDDMSIWGIAGDGSEHLSVTRSSVTVSAELAICNFSEITLQSCDITDPADGVIRSKAIVNAGGEVASKVVISAADPHAIPGYLLGDTDGNGDVDISDATQIQRYLAHMDTVDTFDASAADVDGADSVTINDATYIQRYLAHMAVDYPIGQPLGG